jgi:hypothetical protein
MSDELKIDLHDGRTAFRPGERLEGVASWQLSKPPTQIEVRLIRAVEGKWVTDEETIETVTFDDPKQTDAQIFQFTLPEEPYSFTGKLIAVQWKVALFISRRRREEVEIILSPTGEILSTDQPAAP